MGLRIVKRKLVKAERPKRDSKGDMVVTRDPHCNNHHRLHHINRGEKSWSEDYTEKREKGDSTKAEGETDQE